MTLKIRLALCIKCMELIIIFLTEVTFLEFILDYSCLPFRYIQ